MIDQSSNSLPANPRRQAQGLRGHREAAYRRRTRNPDDHAEAGFPGIEVAIWHGPWAPKGTPKDIVDKLNAAAIKAMQDPEIRRKLEDLGQDIPTPEQMKSDVFGAYQKAEFAKWKPIIDRAGVEGGMMPVLSARACGGEDDKGGVPSTRESPAAPDRAAGASPAPSLHRAASPRPSVCR